MVNQESDKDSCPEELRDEGSLFKSRKGSLPPASYPNQGLAETGGGLTGVPEPSFSV